MKKKAVILLVVMIFSQFLGINHNLSAQGIEQDSLVLVALYNSTDGANWTDNSNWLTGPVLTWFGITVSEGYVTKIKLNINNLVGPIPSEIGNISNLTSLSANLNQLSGSIPAEICSLNNLINISFDRNQLSGSIPSQIGNLSNLKTLSLSFNQLSGTIPVEIGNLTNLKYLDLCFNHLSDTLPAEFGNLTQLIRLYLFDNQLSGVIQSEFSNFTNLERFYLSNNQFTDLPDLSSITTLTNLEIQNNQFTFEDIELNIGIANFIYSPQDSVGEKQDTTINQGSNLMLTVSIGGTANQYQWTKNGSDISGAHSSSYPITSAESADEGSYICKITNTIATELTLYSRPINVTVSDQVGTDGIIKIPNKFTLYQNYPNPFNSSTLIKYDLPKTSKVILKIYNLFGQDIKTLVNELQTAGEKIILWDGLNEQGEKISSGIYIYKIETSTFSQSNKMIMIN